MNEVEMKVSYMYKNIVTKNCSLEKYQLVENVDLLKVDSSKFGCIYIFVIKSKSLLLIEEISGSAMFARMFFNSKPEVRWINCIPLCRINFILASPGAWFYSFLEGCKTIIKYTFNGYMYLLTYFLDFNQILGKQYVNYNFWVNVSYQFFSSEFI